MPFVNRPQPQGFGPPAGLAPEIAASGLEGVRALRPEDDTPSFLDAVGANLIDFGVGSVYLDWRAAQEHPAGPPIEGFNPLDDIEGYEDMADEFVGLVNPELVKRKKWEIDIRRRARDDISRSGAKGIVAMLAAGAIDPLLFVPGLTAANMTRRLGQTATAIAKGTVLSKSPVLRNIARGVIITEAATVAGVAATQSTNELATWQEAAEQVTAGALLGAAFGGSPAVLRAIRDKRMVRQADADLHATEVSDGTIFADGAPSSAGAQTVPKRNAILRPFGLLGRGRESKVFKTLTLGKLTRTPTAKTSPYMRMATSDVAEVRRVNQELNETNLQYLPEPDGAIPPTVLETEEKLIREVWQAWYLRGRKTAYKRYAKRMKGEGLPIIRFEQFREEISYALNTGDTHAIPEIGVFAKAYRKTILTPSAERAMKAQLKDVDGKVIGTLLHADTLTRDVVGAASYLTRMFDHPRIIVDTEGWLNATRAWIMQRHPELLPEEIPDAAQQIADHITGGSGGRGNYGPYQLVGTRRPTKARTFDIDHDIIKGFLVQDLDEITAYYLRTMVSDTLLTERFGSPGMEAMLDPVRGTVAQGYARLSRAAKTPQERIRLDKRKKRDIRDIAATRDIIRHVYGIPEHPNGIGHRWSLGIRRGTVMIRLPEAMISSVPDSAFIAMEIGITRTYGSLLQQGIGRIKRGFQKQDIRSEDLFAFAASTEHINNGRVRSLYDFGDDFGRSTIGEKGLAWGADRFGRLSGLARWNTIWKSVSAITSNDRLFRNAARLARGQGLDARETAWLLQNSIGKDELGRIHKMWQKHGGTDEGGLRYANIGTWTDRKSALLVKLLTKRGSDKSLQTPSAGDIPLFMRRSGGSIVGVGRSFGFAVMHNIFLAGLQRHDAAFYSGLMMAVTLGMMTYATKSWLHDRTLSDDPRVWVAEGIDRSGVLGYLMDVNFAVERLSGNRYGLAALTGAPPLSRRSGGDLGEAILGIPFSMLNDTGDLMSTVLHGKTPKAHQFTRLAPYANLWYLQAVIRAVQEANR